MTQVLVVLDGYAPGLAGAEHMAWQTASHLAERGHRVAVLAASSRPEAPGRVPVLTPAHARAGLPWAPDVVHVFDLARPGLVPLALEVARSCGAVLAVTPATTPELWPDRELATAACREAGVVFALTGHETRELTAAGAVRLRVQRIGQGPQLTGRPDPGGFRADRGITGPAVLFLGRRAPFKGYPAFLEAAPLVWAREPSAVMVLAGPSWEGGEEASLPRGGRFCDLGVPDGQTKHDAIAACDVLCLPTTADVFPLVFVEAWACGRPVVSGRFPGVEEVVRDEVDGLVVPSRPDAIAAALLRLLGDPDLRAGMGRAGRRRVEAELGWDRVAEQVERGYRSAGAGGRTWTQ